MIEATCLTEMFRWYDYVIVGTWMFLGMWKLKDLLDTHADKAAKWIIKKVENRNDLP